MDTFPGTDLRANGTPAAVACFGVWGFFVASVAASAAPDGFVGCSFVVASAVTGADVPFAIVPFLAVLEDLGGASHCAGCATIAGPGDAVPFAIVSLRFSVGDGADSAASGET